MDKNLEIIPRVTVVLPAYNAAKYLRLSIESILNQTYPHFTLLILNDGSNDETENIVLSYTDPRIKYEKNSTNLGLVKTLNKGIDLTETEFLLRMDADDIAIPKRLEWQVQFMDKHPDVGLLGGKYEMFGQESGIPDVPLEDADVKASLLFTNSIMHPTVMLRTRLIKDNQLQYGVPFKFRDDFGSTILELEDYGLWHKMRPFTRFSNINNVLIRYRKEGQNLTQKNIPAIQERKKMFFRYLLEEMGITPSDIELQLHCSLNYLFDGNLIENIETYKKLLDKINAANLLSNIYERTALKKMTKKKWDQVFFRLPPAGLRYVVFYWKISGKIKLKHLLYFLKVKFNYIAKNSVPN